MCPHAAASAEIDLGDRQNFVARIANVDLTSGMKR